MCVCMCCHCIVRCAKQQGIMFLGEVALGKEHTITRDDGSLRRAPSGCHSVVARGHTEPGVCVCVCACMCVCVCVCLSVCIPCAQTPSWIPHLHWMPSL